MLCLTSISVPRLFHIVPASASHRCVRIYFLSSSVALFLIASLFTQGVALAGGKERSVVASPSATAVDRRVTASNGEISKHEVPESSGDPSPVLSGADPIPHKDTKDGTHAVAPSAIVADEQADEKPKILDPEPDVADDIPSADATPGGGFAIEGSPFSHDVESIDAKPAGKKGLTKADKVARKRARADMFHSMLVKEAEGELKMAHVRGDALKRKTGALANCANELSGLRLKLASDVFNARVSALDKKREKRYSRIASGELVAGVTAGATGNVSDNVAPSEALASGGDEERKVGDGAPVVSQDVVRKEGSDEAVVPDGAKDHGARGLADSVVASVPALKARYRSDVGNLKKATWRDIALIRDESKTELGKIRHDYGVMHKNSIGIDFGTQFIFSGGVDASAFVGILGGGAQQGSNGLGAGSHSSGSNIFSFAGSVSYTRAISKFMMLVVGFGSRGYNNDLVVSKGDIPKPSISSTNLFVGLGTGVYKKGPFVLGSSVGVGVAYLSIFDFPGALQQMMHGASSFYGVGASFSIGLNGMYFVTKKQTLGLGAALNVGPMYLSTLHPELGYVLGGNFDFTHRFRASPEVELYYKLAVSLVGVHGTVTSFAFTNYLVSLNLGVAYKF